MARLQASQTLPDGEISFPKGDKQICTSLDLI